MEIAAWKDPRGDTHNAVSKPDILFDSGQTIHQRPADWFDPDGGGVTTDVNFRIIPSLLLST